MPVNMFAMQRLYRVLGYALCDARSACRKLLPMAVESESRDSGAREGCRRGRPGPFFGTLLFRTREVPPGNVFTHNQGMYFLGISTINWVISRNLLVLVPGVIGTPGPEQRLDLLV